MTELQIMEILNQSVLGTRWIEGGGVNPFELMETFQRNLQKCMLTEEIERRKKRDQQEKEE